MSSNRKSMRLAALALMLALAVPGALAGDGYTYAGLSSRARYGIAATVSLERVVQVGGHFAVWAGVDGQTRTGRQSWLQVGVEQEPGDSTPHLYLELMQPQHPRRFLDLGPVAAGRRLRVAVVKTALGWVAIAPSGLYGPFRLPAKKATVTAEALADASGRASAVRIQVAGPRGTWERLPGAQVLHDDRWKLHLLRDGFEAGRVPSSDRRLGS
jgi:hypothetical protein